MQQTIQSIIDNLKSAASLPVKKSEYVEFDIQDIIATNDAHYNSKFVSGSTDSLGRDKQFLNVNKAKVAVSKRATDIDTANIRFVARDREEILRTFVMNKKLHQYFKRSKSNSWFNDWGKELPKQGSCVTKYVEIDGELKPNIIPLDRLYFDPTDFYASPIGERLFLTEFDLKTNSAYDQDVVDRILSSTKTSKKTQNNSSLTASETFYEIEEWHGYFPDSLKTENENDKDLTLQMIVICPSLPDEVIFHGYSERIPYVIDHWDKEIGRALGVGVVEDMGTIQELTNFNLKATVDQLTLATKIIYQTTDGSLSDVNVLNHMDNGDIIVTAPNGGLTQLANSADIASVQAFQSQLDASAQELTSTYDAITGATMPSGTAFRSVAVQNKEARGLFELITENKANQYINNHLRPFIIPFLMKNLRNYDEIIAELSGEELAWWDDLVMTHAMNEFKVKNVLEGKIVTPEMEATYAELYKQGQQKGGKKRYLSAGKKMWSQYFKGYDQDCEIEITGESSDKQSKLESLFNLLQVLTPATPQGRVVLEKITELSGAISPAELGVYAPQSPAGAEVTNQGQQQ